MFSLLTRGVCVLAAFLVSFPRDGDEARKRHYWEFPVGSWVKFESTNDYFIDGEKRHDTSTWTERLKNANESTITLIREREEFGETVIEETTEELDEQMPWLAPPSEEEQAETLTVDGQEIACRIIRFDKESEQYGQKFQISGEAWWSDRILLPLKMRTRLESDGEKQSQETVVEKLDVEISIGERKFRCIELVQRELGEDGTTAKSRRTSRTWYSEDVPGGLVKSVMEDREEGATDRFVTEVVDFFIAPQAALVRVENHKSTAVDMGSCEIVGRLVDSDGRPLAGLHASLRARPNDHEELSKHGVAPKWVDLEATSDEDGRLLLKFAPPTAFEFFFEVEGTGVAKENWRWRSLAAGACMDLGEIRMQPGGAIAGFLVDAEGHDVPGGFYVVARGHEDTVRQRGKDRETPYEYGMPEKGSNRFRIEGLPPGTYEVEPYLHAAGWSEEAKVTAEVVAGKETRVELRYTGSSLKHRIRINTFVEPFFILAPASEHVKLTGPDGRVFAAEDGGVQSLDFNGVTDGPCDLVIDDPRFETVRRDGLRPGMLLEVMLRGSARFQVVATDAKSGQPIVDVAVSQELHRVKTSPNRFALRLVGGWPIEDGIIPGVIPGDSKAYVSADGYDEVELDVDDLGPREMRTLEVALACATPSAAPGLPASISGIVRDALDGAPLSNMLIEAQKSDVDDFDSERATTDAQGRFHLSGLKPGSWSVQAKRSETIESATYRFQLAAGEQRSDLEIGLARGVEVSGTVSGLNGFPIQRLNLLFARVDDERPRIGRNDDRFAWFDAQDAELEVDGRFVARDLAPGRYRVGLQIDGEEVEIGPSHTMHSPQQRFVVDEVELSADHDSRFDFCVSAFRPGAIVVRVRTEGPIPRSWLAIARTADGPTRQSEQDEANLFDFDREEEEEEDGQSTLHSRDDFSFESFRDVDGVVTGGLANIGSDGTARLGTLRAGRWIVGIRMCNGAWTVEHPRPVALAPGESTECEIDVALEAATLTLVDAASGVVLTGANVRWLHSTSPRAVGVRSRTDEEGRLELALPRGRVRLWDLGNSRRKKDDPRLATEIEWPPVEGTVSIRRAPPK